MKNPWKGLWVDPVFGLQAPMWPYCDILRLWGHMPLLEQSGMCRLMLHRRTMHIVSCTMHQVQISAAYSRPAGSRPYAWPGLIRFGQLASNMMSCIHLQGAMTVTTIPR